MYYSIIINQFNTLSASFTKWLPTNCLSVFDHFVRLALKGLSGPEKFKATLVGQYQKLFL